MINIGILGANGQVGSEVCLFLSQMEDINVIPICRTVLGSSLLRRCGLECRHGRIDDPAEAKQALEGCDLVADFTLPNNYLAFDTRDAIKRNITNAIERAPSAARFVYISSLMALGVGPGDQTLRPRIVSRTTYGANKRYAERLAFRLGKKKGCEVYVLRLGQVHGELQSVSRGILRRLDEKAYVPQGKSYAVFAYTIAEALAMIGRGLETPGRYSLISLPEWSWSEVYEYYARCAQVKPSIVIYDDVPEQRPGILKPLKFLVRMAVNPIIRAARNHREMITAYGVAHFPALEQKLRANWGRRSAIAEVAQMKSARVQGEYQPFKMHKSESPGKHLQSLTDCRTSMLLPVKEVKRRLKNLAPKSGATEINGFDTPPPPVAVASTRDFFDQ